ncbi:TatD family hydrolase [Alteromonas sp. D210916BOD_24]|uniref:TatD family hydrolase n=1 Tax=Alteromonas sp. D210916BOD_24 TaxID=3157618 RepID=UPI00399CBBD0
MIDSHCHLNLPALADNVESVLREALNAGITRIMVPGIDEASWRVIQQISDKYTSLLPIDTAIGFHPYFLTQHSLAGLHDSAGISDKIDQLEQAAHQRHSSVKAIGETGLDAHIQIPMALQQEALKAHLMVAVNLGLPVILHHRKSHHLLLEALKANPVERAGVIHAFSGNVDVAKRYLDNGFYLGLGGTITYPRARKTRDTATFLLKHHPERILLETDAPDMPMYGRQGQANKPQYLCEVVSALSALGDLDTQTIIDTTTANYQKLFLN